MSTQSHMQALHSAVLTVLVFLSRAPVQRQLSAFCIGMGLAWGIAYVLRGSLGRRLRESIQGHEGTVRWTLLRTSVPIVAQLSLPALALLVMHVMRVLLETRGWTVGLLRESVLLLWAFLLYRLLIALSETILGEDRTRPYRRRLIGPLFWLVVGSRVLDFVVDLDTLSDVQVLKLTGATVTVGTLTTIGVVLYFLYTGAWMVQHVLQGVIIPRTAAEPGLVNAALTIGRYAVIAVGASFVLSALGFDTSTITFISGGLSIAIAFGSQQLFANFVSGILLLFEQSLRPGDIVSIAGEMGVVERLGIRATRIRTLDNTVLVVPNQTILTSALRNYTKEDPRVRTSLKLSAQGRIDPRALGELLLEVARQHDAVRQTPPPELLFTSFSLERISIELQVWLDSALQIPQVTSELHLMIRDELVKQDLTIV